MKTLAFWSAHALAVCGTVCVTARAAAAAFLRGFVGMPAGGSGSQCARPSSDAARDALVLRAAQRKSCC